MGAPVDGPQPRGRGPSRYKYNTRRVLHIREARDLARKFLMGNIKYRERIERGLENGTLHPLIEKAYMEIAEYFPKGKGTEVHLNVGTGEGAGLLNILLRRPLNEDPLAKAKPVEGKVVKDDKALPPKLGDSIIPPSRPTKVKLKSKAAPLGPDEGVMP